MKPTGSPAYWPYLWSPRYWLPRSTQKERVRHALATNLSDLLRYQNMLSGRASPGRWARRASPLSPH